MNSSREVILNRLQSAQPSWRAIERVREHLPVVPIEDSSPQRLLDLFVEQAESLASVVHLPTTPVEAIETILDLTGKEQRVLSWAFEHIPLRGLAEAFKAHDIEHTLEGDASVQTGITGVDAALSATGSLVLLTGEGKPRLTSLLPPVHIAVIHQRQIYPDLETWVATLRQKGLDAFQEIASTMIISGPSRTADIAMQLTLGMHGPGELHIIILS